MFKIYDGREYFYQWDIDRQIIVEDRNIIEAHFYSRANELALVCECYDLDGEWVANVPNILLQDNWRLHVYAYDGNATLFDKCFEIKSRSKPNSYVYTETEIKTYKTLEEKIAAIYEDLDETIADYFVKNPVEVDLSDYYNKEETDNKFALKEEVPTIVGLATEKYVDEKVGSIKIPEVDFTGYATETYVDEAIAANVPEVDLSDYYNKAQIDDLLANLPVGDIPSGEEVKF